MSSALGAEDLYQPSYEREECGGTKEAGAGEMSGAKRAPWACWTGGGEGLGLGKAVSHQPPIPGPGWGRLPPKGAPWWLQAIDTCAPPLGLPQRRKEMDMPTRRTRE
eukprot:scaffold170575_cov30-Tisochrysis_lutea.AAC.2